LHAIEKKVILLQPEIIPFLDLIGLFMQRTKYFLLLFFSMFFLVACQRTEINYYPDGKPESTVTYKGGKLNGTSVWYYEHGLPRLEITYRNGLKEGQMIRFFRNGAKETVENYKEDRLHGEALEFNETGVLILELHYENGKKEGTIKQYYPDGSELLIGQYTDDQYDKTWEYFDKDGFKTGEGHFVKGKGTLTAYGNNGNIIRKIYYANSIIEKEEIYAADKQQTAKTIIYENERIVAIKMNTD
jgi:antitoxin component YwqK of YwqJK toxin-antitoxin module